MRAHALAREDTQLGLCEGWMRVPRLTPPRRAPKLCQGCKTREARYGFREKAGEERPRTLCFECFRMELDRRQRAIAQQTRGPDAEQGSLPLADVLERIAARRRRGQMAARRAIGLIECP